MTDFLLLTCEHGGNRVPVAFRQLFRGQRKLLDSHRGYDPGSLELARTLARQLHAPLHFVTVTRLLVELNRSLSHPALFSSVTRSLPKTERDALLQEYYIPHRNRVEAEIAAQIRSGQRVLHLSIHTFTPVLDGEIRRADVGLLYDPARSGETEFCNALKSLLAVRRPDLIVRKNYPYTGKSDGFTTALRKKFPAAKYVGVEIEVNQRWPLGNRRKWKCLGRDLSKAIGYIFVTVRRV